MPSIVTATELRTILGVSSSLYSDAYLNDIIDSSESVILPMLVTYKAPIAAAELSDNVATIKTQGDHPFSIGQSVVIAGVSATFNGTKTITGISDDHTELTYAQTAADVDMFNVIPAGSATLTGASTYVGNSAVESAVLSVCVQIFQNRTAGGGSIEGVDFSVTPFRMSRGLFSSVTGLLGQYLDVASSGVDALHLAEAIGKDLYPAPPVDPEPVQMAELCRTF